MQTTSSLFIQTSIKWERVGPNRGKWFNLKRAVSTDDCERWRVAVGGSESTDDNVIYAIRNVFMEDVRISFDIVSKEVCRRADQQNIA